MRIHRLRTVYMAVLAALSLLACTAPSANAALALTLKRIGALMGGTYLEVGTKETVTGEREGTAIMTVPSKSVEFRCEKGALSEAFLENIEPKAGEVIATGSGKTTLSECRVFDEKTKAELVACTKEFNAHNNEGKPFSKAKITAYLHHHVSETGTVKDRLLALAGPVSGSQFTTIEFGGTCSLPEEVEIKGEVVGEILGFTDAVKVKASVDSGSTEGKEINELIAITPLKFGANPAYIKGQGYLTLTGKNLGKAWGGM